MAGAQCFAACVLALIASCYASTPAIPDVGCAHELNSGGPNTRRVKDHAMFQFEHGRQKFSLPLASVPTTSATSMSVFTSDFDEGRYVAVDKTLFIWNAGDLGTTWDWGTEQIGLLVSVCRVHGFRSAIVFIGSVQLDWDEHFRVMKIPHEERFVMLFGSLREAGVVPYGAFYLNDSPNNFTAWERAADVVSALHNFNRIHPNSAVAGIYGDQEPTDVDDVYLNMNMAMQTRRDALRSDLEIAVSVTPSWLLHEYRDIPWPYAPMADVALRDVHAGLIMAFSRNPEKSTNWGDQALAIASAGGRRLSVAIDTNPRAPTSDSYWEMASGTERTSFLQLVADMDAHYRAGGYAAAYGGLVIHDYEGFFEAMYGMKATAYPQSIVTALYQQ